MDRHIRLVSERGFLAFYDQRACPAVRNVLGAKGSLSIQSTRPEFSEVRDYVL